MSDLHHIKARIDILRKGRLTPTSVGLSRESWTAIRAEFAAEKGLVSGKLPSGEDVFGVPVTVHPGLLGDFIAYDGGLEPVG